MRRDRWTRVEGRAGVPSAAPKRAAFQPHPRQPEAQPQPDHGHQVAKPLVRQLVRHHEGDVAAVEQRGGGGHQQRGLAVRDGACRARQEGRVGWRNASADVRRRRRQPIYSLAAVPNGPRRAATCHHQQTTGAEGVSQDAGAHQRSCRRLTPALQVPPQRSRGHRRQTASSGSHTAHQAAATPRTPVLHGPRREVGHGDEVQLGQGVGHAQRRLVAAQRRRRRVGRVPQLVHPARTGGEGEGEGASGSGCRAGAHPSWPTLRGVSQGAGVRRAWSGRAARGPSFQQQQAAARGARGGSRHALLSAAQRSAAQKPAASTARRGAARTCRASPRPRR